MCNAHDHDTAHSEPLVLRGLHHDYLGELEQSGQLQLLNKQFDRFGVYRADAYMNGLLKLGATFFPQQWTHEMVITKVMEAYDNVVSSNPQIIAQPNNLYRLQGITQEGIIITLFMNREGEIIIAYPSHLT